MQAQMVGLNLRLDLPELQQVTGPLPLPQVLNVSLTRNQWFEA